MTTKLYTEADTILAGMNDAVCLNCTWHGSQHETDEQDGEWFCPDCGKRLEYLVFAGGMKSPTIKQDQVDEFLRLLLQATLEFNRKYHFRKENNCGHTAAFDMTIHGDLGFRVIDWSKWYEVESHYVVGEICNEFPVSADKFDPIVARDLLWAFARLINKLEHAAKAASTVTPNPRVTS